jgi:hypothetical protein
VPEPTIAAGASHADAMRHGGHVGHDATTSAVSAADSAAPAGHGAAAAADTVAHRHEEAGDSSRAQRGGMTHGETMHGDAAHGDAGAMVDSALARRMMEVHMRLMADPVIRQRIMADTAMRHLMREMMSAMPAEHREHMEHMMNDVEATPAAKPARRPAGQGSRQARSARTPQAGTRARSTPVAMPDSADRHAGHGAPSEQQPPTSDPHARHRP